MERYASIPSIKGGVVFSDPWYKDDVWCQYRKEFDADNWYLKMDATTMDGYTSFDLTLGRSTMMGTTNIAQEPDGQFSLQFPGRYAAEKVVIGMDTAQVFFGSMKNWNEFGESGALHTGTDGAFGDLFVLTCKGEKDPAGFILLAGVEEMFANEEKLFQHILSSFGGKEISRGEFEQCVDPASLYNRLLSSRELGSASKTTKNPSKEKDSGQPER